MISKKNRKTRIFLFFFGLAVSSLSAGMSFSNAEFAVQMNAFYAPQGYIFLLRSGGATCAVKIVETSPPGEKQNSGQAIKYEFLQISENNTIKNAEFHSGRLELVGRIRFGHWSLDRGTTTLKCGSKRIGWSYPNEFYLDLDYDLSIAPTAWVNFSDVDSQDSRLQWVIGDKERLHRREMHFPIQSLPGFFKR